MLKEKKLLEEGEKPLNIYHVYELWSDGNDEYIVLTAFVRAGDEQQALSYMADSRPEGIPESSKVIVEMIGWATGDKMYDGGLITIEFNPENL